MSEILDKLRGGDRRSIGRANEVVAEVLQDPALFEPVLYGMLDDDPLVRMRAADVVEKVTVRHPEYLVPHRKLLIGAIAPIEQQEVRWHVAQMIPRLAWTKSELPQVADILRGYLGDESRIVKTSTLQALAELVEQEPKLYGEVVALLEAYSRVGSPAMRSRGRKLLAQLKAGAGSDN